MKCPRCGNEVSQNDKVCPMCGSGMHISAAGKKESKKSGTKKASKAASGTASKKGQNASASDVKKNNQTADEKKFVQSVKKDGSGQASKTAAQSVKKTGQTAAAAAKPQKTDQKTAAAVSSAQAAGVGAAVSASEKAGSTQNVKTGKTFEKKQTESFDADAAKSEKKPNRMKIILIILLAAAVIGGVIGYFYYQSHYVAKEIHLGQTSIEMITGESEQLNYEILPPTTKNKDVVWSVDDDSVATVDENGTVYAQASGICTVTVTTSNDKSDSCEVTVKDFVDIQKESVDAVHGFIANAGTQNEDGSTIVTVKTGADGSSFSLAAEDDDLLLVSEMNQELSDMDITASYTTKIRLSYGNIENAAAIQVNNITISGIPVNTIVEGTILLADYKAGDAIDYELVESDLDGIMESESLRTIVSSGAARCYSEFEAFLAQHPELGCTISDFGFVAVQEEAPDYGTSSEASSVPAEAESETVSAPESAAEAAERDGAESVIEPLPETTASVPPEVVVTVESMETISESVQETVESVQSAAAESIAEAAESVQTAAAAESVEEIQSTAEPSIAEVESVQSTSESAVTEAEPVQSTAESALEAAEPVQSTAESALEAAEPVQSAVESAVTEVEPVQSAAESVQSTADEIQGIKSAAAVIDSAMADSAAESAAEEMESVPSDAVESMAENAAESDSTPENPLEKFKTGTEWHLPFLDMQSGKAS